MLQSNIQVHSNLFSLIPHQIILMVAKNVMDMDNVLNAMMDFGWVSTPIGQLMI